MDTWSRSDTDLSLHPGAPKLATTRQRVVRNRLSTAALDGSQSWRTVTTPQLRQGSIAMNRKTQLASPARGTLRRMPLWDKPGLRGRAKWCDTRVWLTLPRSPTEFTSKEASWSDGAGHSNWSPSCMGQVQRIGHCRGGLPKNR